MPASLVQSTPYGRSPSPKLPNLAQKSSRLSTPVTTVTTPLWHASYSKVVHLPTLNCYSCSTAALRRNSLTRSSHLCFAFSLITTAFLSGCACVPNQASHHPCSRRPSPPRSTPHNPRPAHRRQRPRGQPARQRRPHLPLRRQYAGYGAPSVSLLKSAATRRRHRRQRHLRHHRRQRRLHLTGDYTCTPGQQVYILATGGNPGLPAGTNNPALALIAVLGTCPSAGQPRQPPSPSSTSTKSPPSPPSTPSPAS